MIILGFAGRIAGGLTGGIHAQMAGDGFIMWAQIGQALGGIVGSYAGGGTTESSKSSNSDNNPNSSIDNDMT